MVPFPQNPKTPRIWKGLNYSRLGSIHIHQAFFSFCALSILLLTCSSPAFRCLLLRFLLLRFFQSISKSWHIKQLTNGTSLFKMNKPVNVPKALVFIPVKLHFVDQAILSILVEEEILLNLFQSCSLQWVSLEDFLEQFSGCDVFNQLEANFSLQDELFQVKRVDSIFAWVLSRDEVEEGDS